MQRRQCERSDEAPFRQSAIAEKARRHSSDEHDRLSEQEQYQRPRADGLSIAIGETNASIAARPNRVPDSSDAASGSIRVTVNAGCFAVGMNAPLLPTPLSFECLQLCEGVSVSLIHLPS